MYIIKNIRYFSAHFHLADGAREEKNCCIVWWNEIIYFIIITYTTYSRDTSINWAPREQPIHRWRLSIFYFSIDLHQIIPLDSRECYKILAVLCCLLGYITSWMEATPPLSIPFHYFYDSASFFSRLLLHSACCGWRGGKKSYSSHPTKICFIVCFAIYIKNIKFLYHDTHIF